ncbi:MAG TPA: acyl-CoA transferase, partial [Dehalococcoidia bacterium]|nr:acyl-CoA transferase [Dehalococcoidia bacterium]
MSKPEYTGGGSLSDLRVLDLTRVWAGPLATRILGDFGAQIIRIVDPRSLMPRASGYDNKLSRNKLNMAVRLDKDAGRQILLELASISDVVIENF